MPLRVRAIRTASGAKLELNNFSVLVGPNNCGKSQTLRDIRDYVATGSTSRLTILNEVEVDLPTEAEATKGVRILPHTSPGHLRFLGVTYDLQNRHEFAPQENWLTEQFRHATNRQNLSHLLSNMGKFWIAHLDAESRFRLASSTDSYDTRTESPSNALQSFFSGGSTALEELRAAFREAFEMDIALDWAGMKRWYLRVGANFGTIPDGRTDLDTLLKDAEELATQGDGYRSFAGVVLAMLTFADRLLLLDEPEAFLHPAQARVLGRWLATRAQTTSAQVILATHNADFLWGIVSANTDATVIRLNRTENLTRYHIIPSTTTKGLAQSPLLSSQPVLDSLFQRGVAVCEGDPDRAVYQTVAHEHLREMGGDDVLFIHANGKDAIATPLKLLRDAGTPVCAIVDIDILNSEHVLVEILRTLSTTPPSDELRELRRNIAEVIEKTTEEQLIADLRKSVDSWLSGVHTELRRTRKDLEALTQGATKWAVVKSRGLAHFEGQDRTNVQRFIDLCMERGLFVVSKGELEGWMSLGASKGKNWNRKALEELHDGNCPGDLRAFIENVVTFLRSAPSVAKPEAAPVLTP